MRTERKQTAMKVLAGYLIVILHLGFGLLYTAGKPFGFAFGFGLFWFSILLCIIFLLELRFWRIPKAYIGVVLFILSILIYFERY